MPPMKTDLGTMGGRVKSARKAAGLSQKQLAEKTGLAQGTISDIEKDKHGSGYAAELGAALGVEALWLRTGQEPRKRSRGPVDAAILKDALLVALRVTEGKEPPERVVRMAVALYEAWPASGKPPDPEAMIELLRAAR